MSECVGLGWVLFVSFLCVSKLGAFFVLPFSDDGKKAPGGERERVKKRAPPRGRDATSRLSPHSRPLFPPLPSPRELPRRRALHALFPYPHTLPHSVPGFKWRDTAHTNTPAPKCRSRAPHLRAPSARRPPPTAWASPASLACGQGGTPPAPAPPPSTASRPTWSLSRRRWPRRRRAGSRSSACLRRRCWQVRMGCGGGRGTRWRGGTRRAQQ